MWIPCQYHWCCHKKTIMIYFWSIRNKYFKVIGKRLVIYACINYFPWYCWNELPMGKQVRVVKSRYVNLPLGKRCLSCSEKIWTQFQNSSPNPKTFYHFRFRKSNFKTPLGHVRIQKLFIMQVTSKKTISKTTGHVHRPNLAACPGKGSKK